MLDSGLLAVSSVRVSHRLPGCGVRTPIAGSNHVLSTERTWCSTHAAVRCSRRVSRDESLETPRTGRGLPALGRRVVQPYLGAARVSGCRNFAFSTTRAPVRLFLPSKLSHPLIYEWVGPNRGAEGVKHTLSSLGSAPQAQEGPTPRPRMRPRCSHSEADRTACSQAVRPAVAFACGIRSSRWLRCFSQSPVARGRRAR